MATTTPHYHLDKYKEFKLEVTCRYPVIRTYGNWVLALAELYIRDPRADRYAVFQDDLITCRKLRQYLEQSPYPEKGYKNLYTFPSNQSYAPAGNNGKPYQGWFESRPLNDNTTNQAGRGAVALVFSREAVTTLLCHQHMVMRPQDAKRGWRAVDGAVVTAMNKAGWREFVHSPSLVQHTGAVSSMRNRPHPQAPYFPGESFDALELLWPDNSSPVSSGV